jgi:hypothetical protein
MKKIKKRAYFFIASRNNNCSLKNKRKYQGKESDNKMFILHLGSPEKS